MMSVFFITKSMSGDYTIGESYGLIAIASWCRLWECWYGY